jgi:hypothetical protein
VNSIGVGNITGLATQVKGLQECIEVIVNSTILLLGEQVIHALAQGTGMTRFAEECKGAT